MSWSGRTSEGTCLANGMRTTVVRIRCSWSKYRPLNTLSFLNSRMVGGYGQEEQDDERRPKEAPSLPQRIHRDAEGGHGERSS